MNTRFPSNLPLLGTAALLVVCLVGRLDETPVGAVVDDAHYVEMARSVAEGRSAVIHVGPESAPEDTVFPPGLPLLLAPLAGLFPTSLTALKVVPILSVALLAFLCLRWPGGESAPRLRVALAAVIVLNPWVIAHAGRIVSDLPFTVISLAAALLFLRACGREHGGAVHWLALGALVGVAVLVRTIGLTLLAAMLLHLAVDRRPGRAALLVAGAAAVVVLPALIGVSGNALPVLGAYGPQLVGHSTDAGARLVFMANNLGGYLEELPVLMVPVFGKAVAGLMAGSLWSRLVLFAQIATALALLGGFAAGLIAAWRRGGSRELGAARFWTVYLALYGLALLNFDGYPSGVQLRLLLPALPVLAWYLLAGVAALPGRWAPAVLLALLLGASLAHNAWRMARPLRHVADASGRGFVDPGVGADWVRANTDPEDVVMAQAPLERHIHLRRPVVAPGDLEARALTARIEEHGVALVLVGPHANGRPRGLDGEGKALLDLVREAPTHYPPVHEEPGEAVFIFGVADAAGRCRWVRPEPIPDR